MIKVLNELFETYLSILQGLNVTRKSFTKQNRL